MKKFIAVLVTLVMCMSFTVTSFAGVGDAYFFGYSEDDLDTTEEMEDVEYYLDKMNYYTKIYVNPAESKFTKSRLNSTFLYFAGHGNRKELNTGEDRGICINGIDGYKDISNIDFSNTQLTILAACKCGYEGSSSTCLAREINENGSKGVLAWRSSVGSQVLAEYTDNYVRYLKRGNTFEEAMINTTEYLLDESGIWYDSPVFEITLFGDGDEYLDYAEELDYNRAYTKAMESAELLNEDFLPYIDDEIEQHIISKDVEYNAGTENYAELEDYIKTNIDSDFDIENYVIKEYGEDYGANLVIFRLLVDDLPSNYGFSVICVDGNAGIINFTNTYNENLDIQNLYRTSSESENYSDKELYNMAIELDGFNYDIDEQYIQKYYDVKKNKVVNEVNTVYIDENEMLICTLNVF